MWMQRVI